MQAAVAREDKAQEKERKKIDRELARETVRRQVAEEKAQRAAKKEAQKLAKAAELTKRKLEAEKKRANRIQVKSDLQTAKGIKKRSLEDQAVERPSKRARTALSRTRSATDTHVATTVLKTSTIEDSEASSSRARRGREVVQNKKQSIVSEFESGRTGRTIKLPSRFR